MSHYENLRSKAEKSNTQLTETEIYNLLHELEKHQVEVELLNKGLLLAKEQASIASEKYIDVKNIVKEIIIIQTGTEAVEACRHHPDIDLVLMEILQKCLKFY